MKNSLGSAWAARDARAGVTSAASWGTSEGA
jgi:hypothetical protein